MKRSKTKKERVAEIAYSQLIENQRVAIQMLHQAHAAMAELAELRTANKLSCSRISGVARELKELTKVMAVYENA